MTTFDFKPAARSQRKARIAIDGPSGAGKTFTALMTATQLGEKVAVIDTERGSATLYSGKGGFAFDHLDLTTHEPETLISALGAAGQAGYDAIIIDSLSHFWMGVGGMLEQADAASTRNRGPFGGWKEVRPMERRMIEALLAYPGHVIVTMRTKTDWVLEKDERGKEKPRRVGLKAEQREGIEYEFDLVGDMDLDHNLVVSKSRCSILADQVIRKPDESFGRTLKDWLNDGTPALTVQDVLAAANRPDATVEQVRGLYEDARKGRLLGAAVGDGATLGELLISRGRSLGEAPQPGEGKMNPEQQREHDALVREVQASETKATRVKAGKEKEPDPFLLDPVVSTDEEWRADFVRRVNECGSLSIWRGLAAELVTQTGAGKVSETDADLLDKRLTAREIELGEVTV